MEGRVSPSTMDMALPVKAPAFDGKDVAGTAKRICDYQIQLQEQLDFHLEQMQKTLNALMQAIGGK